MNSREGLSCISGKGYHAFRGRATTHSGKGLPHIPGKGHPTFWERATTHCGKGLPHIPGKGYHTLWESILVKSYHAFWITILLVHKKLCITLLVPRNCKGTLHNHMIITLYTSISLCRNSLILASAQAFHRVTQN